MNRMMKNILFICIENACRSQMAEAFANIHGQGIVRAYSSGSKPSGKVNDKAILVMQELGYDLTTHYSKSFDDISDVEFDTIVTMGCGDACPSIKASQRIEWNVPDPINLETKEFSNVRGLIEEKVKILISEIIKQN